MSEPVRFSLEGSVARLHFDDGKANVISPRSLEAFHAALDRAEKEASAVAILGRTGRFCAGFDLNVMQSGTEPARSLVAGGARLAARLASMPLPVVAGCGGHALAMGALLLLAADVRIGAGGDFKLGLNEVAIGLPLPAFAQELARERLSKRHLLRATTFAELYAPAAACDAGFLDRVVPADALDAETLAEAARLAELPRGALVPTKQALRGAMVDRILGDLAANLAGWRPA